METRPYISIVMPVYNALQYLNQTVESIVEQSFQDFELIMVDDCSTDGSKGICEQWANRDARIQVLQLEKNGGAGNARNQGIACARGTYLAFMDADDVIEKELYQKAVDSLKKSPADIVVWGLTEDYYDQKGNLLSQNQLKMKENYCVNADAVRKQVIQLEERTLFGYQWNRLYRLSLIREHQIQFENSHLYEDYFFNVEVIRYAETMNILSCTDYHYNKRMNQSLTAQYVKEYFALSKRRVETMLQLYREWNLCTTKVKDTLGNIYLRYILSALMRNCDKRANMQHRDRKIWIQQVTADVLYRDIVVSCKTKEKPLQVLQKLMNLHWMTGCLLLGRGVYLAKNQFPMIFSKMKQKH